MKGTVYFLQLILVFGCINVELIAQQDFFVESINTEQGLSQGSIYDILQDSDGFLWLGTKDGLNRYDGHNFKIFTNEVTDKWSISGNTINLLFEDSSGRIWAASENEGINIYDKTSGRFHHIFNNPNDPTSLSGNQVTSIVEDSSGYFIVAIAQNELNMFQLDSLFFIESIQPKVIRLDISSISNNASTDESVIRGLVKDAKGRIWVGSEKGTYKFDVQKAKFTLQLDDYKIGTIFPDEKGGMWSCGNKNPLAYFDGTKAIKLFDFVIPAWDLRLDKNDNLWASTANKVYTISLKDWQNDKLPNTTDKRIFFTWRPPLTDGDYAVRSLHIDRSGIVWVGGNGKGLYKINPNRKLFSLFLPGTSIRQIVPITNDKHLVFTYGTFWHSQGQLHRSILVYC